MVRGVKFFFSFSTWPFLPLLFSLFLSPFAFFSARAAELTLCFRCAVALQFHVDAEPHLSLVREAERERENPTQITRRRQQEEEEEEWGSWTPRGCVCFLFFETQQPRALLFLASEREERANEAREEAEKNEKKEKNDSRFLLLRDPSQTVVANSTSTSSPLFSPHSHLPPFFPALLTPPKKKRFQSFIERNMQSAEERDQWWAAYTRQVDDARKKIRSAWALPTKAPGFWKSPLSEARFEAAHAPGIRSLRRKTIDEE